MFRKLLLTLLLVVLGWPCGAAEPGPVAIDMSIPSGQLTLHEAQRLALHNAPGIAEAAARIAAAQAVVDQARAGLLPTVTAYAGYHYQDMTMQPDWEPELRVNDSLTSSSAGIQVSWLLFDGFSRRARILAAGHQADASRAEFDEARRLLTDAVSSAFFQAQLAVEGMLIASQNRDFNRTLEKDADIRWQAGTIPEAEKLNFSVRALQAESDFLEAARNFSVISTILAELLALPETHLPEELSPVSSLDCPLPPEVPPYATETAFALQNRPDLKALEASLKALAEERKIRTGSYYPRLILNGGVDYEKATDVGTIDQEEHDSYVGLDLSWDLFRGGERPAKLREIEQRIRQVRQQQQQRLLAVRSEIRQAHDRATIAYTIYQRQALSLQLTGRIRDHVEKAYRAGVATLTRLNEAQTDLVRAAAAVAASRINYLQALQSLQIASGRVLADFENSITFEQPEQE